MRRHAAYRHSSGTSPRVAVSTPYRRMRPSSGEPGISRGNTVSEAWQQGMALTRYEEIAGTNHFTVIDPLANPGSPMTARVAALAYSVKSIAL